MWNIDEIQEKGPHELRELDGRYVSTVALHMVSPVYAVAYSPDGTRLASGSGDQTILFSDPKDETAWRSGKEDLPELVGHDGHVYAIAFSSNGERLVSGSANGIIKVWPTMHKAGTVTLAHGGKLVRVSCPLVLDRLE